MGGPIINSSELGWAAIGQSASWGKHCQGGVPLVQGRLSTTPLPNTPSRLPTNTPHPPNGMWFARLIVERGCPWPGGWGTRLNVCAEYAPTLCTVYPQKLDYMFNHCMFNTLWLPEKSGNNGQEHPNRFLAGLLFFTSPPSGLISPPSSQSPPPSTQGATASFAKEI